ncbi:MAG: nicotinate-nucleotide--dimethylbenzimidazole phosphoribosyltransferase [Candidatus Rokubacteria bacterium]|nr:nicotinate-nucleotide--dimethylbenzimidazole phosphoribosyltransferase [Candidatus Rokubacteria bacterium]
MLARLLDAIAPPDAAAGARARGRLDELTKPPGSLGRLEEIVVRLASVRGQAPTVNDPVIFTFAADHGVAAEGVSAYPQSVTAQMVENFLRGGAAINVLAREVEARLVVADFGVATALGARAGLVDRRQGPGTRNMTAGSAMTREEAVAAIEAGAGLALDAIDRGADLVGTGEMGIANTTSASAIASVLLSVRPEAVTGRGTGVDDEALARKTAVIQRAIGVNRPDATDALDVLAKVGGFEIAGLAGVVLAAASRRVPVVLDGFIATAAALVAARLAPAARHAMLASHRSTEPGHALMLEDLGLVPYLDLGMRLGEGTGAALFVHLARAAVSVYRDMATFKSAGIDGPAGGAAT